MKLRIPITTFVLTLVVACSHGGAPEPAASNVAGVASAAPVLITMFYAYPAKPAAGEKVSLCYGVENASDVRLDPPIERVWPSLNHCIDVPSQPATYTLTAQRGDERVSQSVTLQIGPPLVKILEVSINKLEFNPGEEATVCYKVRNAVTTTIQPGAWIEPHRPDLGCVRDRPKTATTYTVTATGAGGDTDSERVTARVR